MDMRMATGRTGATLIATAIITARATVRGLTAIPDPMAIPGTAIATITPTIVGQA